jgi:hypothetical protein
MNDYTLSSLSLISTSVMNYETGAFEFYGSSLYFFKTNTASFSLEPIGVDSLTNEADFKIFDVYINDFTSTFTLLYTVLPNTFSVIAALPSQNPGIFIEKASVYLHP